MPQHTAEAIVEQRELATPAALQREYGAAIGGFDQLRSTQRLHGQA
jgi:hypothetical protein